VCRERTASSVRRDIERRIIEFPGRLLGSACGAIPVSGPTGPQRPQAPSEGLKNHVDSIRRTLPDPWAVAGVLPCCQAEWARRNGG